MKANKFLGLACIVAMMGCLTLGYVTLDPITLVVGTGFGVLGVVLWNEER